VSGDGRSTIRELVDQVNRDPRRGENYTDQLTLLKLDDAALIELGKQGLDADAIPEAGRRVLIQAVGDLTTDCTSDVHPANAAKAVLAARVVGLDIAGLDVVAQDIREPLEDQRGAILEVNAGPSLAMHVAPLHGRPQPVGAAIVDLLYPAGNSSRIPLMAVGGDGRRARLAAELARLLGKLLADQHRGVALGTSDGLFMDGVRAAPARSTDRDQLDALLLHPLAEFAIWESRPQEAAQKGIGYERFDIAVISDLTARASDDADDGELAVGKASQELRDGCLALAHAVDIDQSIGPDRQVRLTLERAPGPTSRPDHAGQPRVFRRIVVGGGDRHRGSRRRLARDHSLRTGIIERPESRCGP